MVLMGRRWETPLRLSTFCLRGRRRRSARRPGDVAGDLDVVGRGAPIFGVRSIRPGFLRCDGDAFFDALRIVGADLATDAVFERGDDLAAGGVVLGVGGEDDGNVEREADGVALNLHVAFLHDVE